MTERIPYAILIQAKEEALKEIEGHLYPPGNWTEIQECQRLILGDEDLEKLNPEKILEDLRAVWPSISFTLVVSETGARASKSSIWWYRKGKGIARLFQSADFMCPRFHWSPAQLLDAANVIAAYVWHSPIWGSFLDRVAETARSAREPSDKQPDSSEPLEVDA